MTLIQTWAEASRPGTCFAQICTTSSDVIVSVSFFHVMFLGSRLALVILLLTYQDFFFFFFFQVGFSLCVCVCVCVYVCVCLCVCVCVCARADLIP